MSATAAQSAGMTHSDRDPERDSYLAVLSEFSTLGYRKASMSALAEAAGVARQTLYNRFGNKEAVLDWAVTGLSAALQQDATACLRAELNKSPAAVLENFFWALLGPVALMLHSGRHAEEILGLSKAALHKTQPDPMAGCGDELSVFLRRCKTKPARQQKDAADTAFLLVMAAKGLMQTCSSETEFRSGIRRAIAGAGF